MTTNETINDIQIAYVGKLVSIINLALMIFGFIGNSFCILVFIRKELSSRKFNSYLLILAISELLYCLFILSNSLTYLTIPPKHLYDLSMFTCYTTDFFVGTIDAFCVLLTLLVSIDRLYAILYPIKVRQFFTNRYPKRVAFIALIIVTLLKLTEVILHQKVFVRNKEEYIDVQLKYTPNSTFYEAPYEYPFCFNVNKSPLHVKLYIIICDIIIPLVFNIIPSIFVLILNGFLFFYMRNYTKVKKSDPSQLTSGTSLRRIQKTTTKQLTVTQKSHFLTIIILGIWLLITSVPYYSLQTLYWIFRLIFIEDSMPNLFDYRVQAISSVFFNSNHCINILIYLLFHKSFRSSTLKIIRLSLRSHVKDHTDESCSKRLQKDHTSNLSQSTHSLSPSIYSKDKIKNSKKINIIKNGLLSIPSYRNRNAVSEL